jgi:hypothetical protein
MLAKVRILSGEIKNPGGDARKRKSFVFLFIEIWHFIKQTVKEENQRP